jgi:hypothetical protein
MSANGISTLLYKRNRQVAKLDLAQIKRLAQNNSRPYYDLTLLPTLYKINNNDTNQVIKNPNPDGLKQGRPWVSQQMP